MNNEVVKPKTTFGDTLRFSPFAYAKFVWMRDRGPTEVAGYCITGTDDPLLVTDFKLIKQKCSTVDFDFDPKDGIDFTERMIDTGLMPWACQNILGHTHPGNCPSPSNIDEQNFQKAFSHPDWAIMLILARGGDIYCRLKINVGPGVVKELKVVIDWSIPFEGSNIPEWEEEYKSKVSKYVICTTPKEGEKLPIHSGPLYGDDYLWEKEYEKWSKDDDEFDFDCHWTQEGDVCYWKEEGDDGVWYTYDPVGQKWYKEAPCSDDMIEEISTPKESWVAKVIAWAEKHSDKRESILKEQECEEGTTV